MFEKMFPGTFKHGDKVKLIKELDENSFSPFPKGVVGRVYTVIDNGTNAHVEIGPEPLVNHKLYFFSHFIKVERRNLPDWF